MPHGRAVKRCWTRRQVHAYSALFSLWMLRDGQLKPHSLFSSAQLILLERCQRQNTCAAGRRNRRRSRRNARAVPESKPRRVPRQPKPEARHSTAGADRQFAPAQHRRQLHFRFTHFKGKNRQTHTSMSSKNGAFSRELRSTVSSDTKRKTCAASLPKGKHVLHLVLLSICEAPCV